MGVNGESYGTKGVNGMVRTEYGQAATGERPVLRLAVGSGLVGSKSEPGLWHAVDGYRCECKSYEYRGRCAHVLALIDAEIRAVGQRQPPQCHVVARHGCFNFQCAAAAIMR